MAKTLKGITTLIESTAATKTAKNAKAMMVVMLGRRVDVLEIPDIAKHSHSYISSRRLDSGLVPLHAGGTGVKPELSDIATSCGSGSTYKIEEKTIATSVPARDCTEFRIDEATSPVALNMMASITPPTRPR
jgi:hypothetical protein